jgi:MYXO-CTERM domain-containing protein
MRPHLPAALLAALAFASPVAAAPHALGLNTHQSATVGLDATRDAGLRWVRIDLNWYDAQPSSGAPDFTLFDGIVDGATARGLSVLAVLAYTPAWASAGDTKGDGPINDVPVAGAYAAFASAAATHFAGKVTHYELWNEPNLGLFFEGTPDDYVQRVLVPGADAIHAACPGCTVLAPGVATVGGQYDVWLDAALTAAKDRIDVVSGHVYAGFPVDSPGAGSSSDSFFNKLEQHRVLKVGDAVVYEGPRSFREVMDQHGVQKPFWLTETGLEAAPGDTTALSAQTLYYRRVLEAMLGRPWWDTTIFYESFDEPASGYTWGVVVHDPSAPSGYQPKPVFSLLKKAAAAQPAFGGAGADCDDGLDNDGDGLVDYPADQGCSSILAKSEGEPPPDGGAMGGGGAGGSGGAGGHAAGGSPGAAKGCACDLGPGDDPRSALVGAAVLAIAASRRRRSPGLRPIERLSSKTRRPPPADRRRRD